MKVVYNSTAVSLEEVPKVSFEELSNAVRSAPAGGRRVAALFAHPAGAGLDAVLVLAADAEGHLEVATAPLEGESFRSMTPDCPQVHLFEREIYEQFGVRPEGHPWLKPVRYQPPVRGAAKPPLIGVADFFKIEGEEIHEVAVGPVHAGVIEPGHFRFQCHGEHVFHLEISLGYQHRGVERAILSGPAKRVVHYMETLAGDTTAGHATAWCQTLEALAGTRASARGIALRGVALELERLANHTGDLGALANDVGFLPTASYCGRLRGDFLNLTAHLCGNRFGRDFVRPGGAGFDVDRARITEAVERLASAHRDVESAARLLWDSASVQARFEETGKLPAEVAQQIGLVGPAARACGLRRDVRKTHPAGIFRFAHVPISTWHTGDVFARAYVRWLEIQRSVVFVRDQLTKLPAGPVRAPSGEPRPNHFCVSLVEGWRGEICHVAFTDERGKIASYKIVDPSFHNWFGLALAMRDQQISDFPLCNKSFNLSYCGHDL